MGAYQRLVKRLGHKAWFAALMSHIAPHLDRLVSKLTGGRKTFGNTVVPTFMLVHTGARSGKEFHTPLAYMTIDASYVVVASNFGKDHHPGWAYNLVAHPDVQVVMDGRTVPVRARRTSDAEKAALWPKLLEVWPAYNSYVEHSGRDIRVFVLDPR